MVLSEQNYGTILAISDIHGYLNAAKSILAVPIAINEAAKEDPRIQGIDTVVFLGDNDMGYGPQQLECIDLEMALAQKWLRAHKPGETWQPSKPVAVSAGSQQELIRESVASATPDLVDKYLDKRQGRNYEPFNVVFLDGNHARGTLSGIESGDKFKVGGNFSNRAAPTIEREVERAFGEMLRTDRDPWYRLICDQASGIKPERKEDSVENRVAELVIYKYMGDILSTVSEAGDKEGENLVTTGILSTFAKPAMIELLVSGLNINMSKDYAERLLAVKRFGWLKRLVDRVANSGYKLELRGHSYNILAAHSNLVKTETDAYVDNQQEAARNLPQGFKLGLVGHTHVLAWGYDPATGNLVANPGSVGDPRKGLVGQYGNQIEGVYPATGIIVYTNVPDPRAGILPIVKDYDFAGTIRLLEARKPKAFAVPAELKELKERKSAA